MADFLPAIGPLETIVNVSWSSRLFTIESAWNVLSEDPDFIFTSVQVLPGRPEVARNTGYDFSDPQLGGPPIDFPPTADMRKFYRSWALSTLPFVLIFVEAPGSGVRLQRWIVNISRLRVLPTENTVVLRCRGHEPRNLVFLTSGTLHFTTWSGGRLVDATPPTIATRSILNPTGREVQTRSLFVTARPNTFFVDVSMNLLTGKFTLSDPHF